MSAVCLSYNHRSAVFPTEEQTHGEMEMGWVEKSLMWQRTFRELLISSPKLAFHEEALLPSGWFLSLTFCAPSPLHNLLFHNSSQFSILWGVLRHGLLVCFGLGAHPVCSCALAGAEQSTAVSVVPVLGRGASARSLSGTSTWAWYVIAFNDNCERRIDGLAVIHRKRSSGRRRTCASRNRQAKWSITCRASQPLQALLPCHRHEPPAFTRVTGKSHLPSSFTAGLVLTKPADVLAWEIGERQRVLQVLPPTPAP